MFFFRKSKFTTSEFFFSNASFHLSHNFLQVVDTSKGNYFDPKRVVLMYKLLNPCYVNDVYDAVFLASERLKWNFTHFRFNRRASIIVDYYRGMKPPQDDIYRSCDCWLHLPYTIWFMLMFKSKWPFFWIWAFLIQLQCFNKLLDKAWTRIPQKGKWVQSLRIKENSGGRRSWSTELLDREIISRSKRGSNPRPPAIPAHEI